MGTLHYGSTAFEIDDDTLRHFAAVMAAKLRRGEPFLALVRDDADGIERVWMHAAASIRIATSPTTDALDQDRLHRMMAQASKASLDLCERPTAAVTA